VTATALLVALFGGLGSALRFGVGVALHDKFSWPFATWLVNVVGSCALGVVVEALEGVRFGSVDARVALGAGLLGGFTTYSAFDIETLRMLERGEWGRAGGYFVGTALACLAAGYAGLALGRVLR
jgi:CrcB protein